MPRPRRVTTEESLNIAEFAQGDASNAVPDRVVLNAPIVTSRPLMPSDASLGIAQQSALSMARESGGSKLAEINPGFASTLNSLELAVNHNEKISSMPTTASIGNAIVQIPPQVRDIPNRLYHVNGDHGQQHYVRERADKILMSLFGSPLGEQVMMAGAGRGFHQKPLVWVSQVLWHHISLDVPHDFGAIAADPETPKFDPDYDEGEGSVVLLALHRCFEQLTVKNLCRLARYHNISVLYVLRVIFQDIVEGLGIKPMAHKKEKK